MKKTSWAAIVLAFFACAGWAEPCCRPETPSGIALDGDLDGDGIPDTLRSISDSGSGTSTTEVELALSRTGKRIEVDAEFSFTDMMSATAVPPELLAPGMERALQAVEDALFDCVCENPDPSLAWLLEKQRSIRWIAGSPTLPGAYAVRKTGEWLFYAGGTHQEIVPVATDPRTGYVLARTAHGVLLIDEKGGRHAWLYVAPDGGGQKLRFPTVAGGRLEDGRAVMRLSRDRAFYGTYACGLLRIDLRDGTFSERWRDLEAAGAGLEPCWAELEKVENQVYFP